MSHVKTAPATFTAVDEAAGTFEALVAVFGNVDAVGDRLMPGAFAKTLAAWAASGDPVPVIWSHQWTDPHMHLGAVTSAVETPQGLLVRGTLDLDAPVAAQVYRLLKGRRVREFSFAYDVVTSRTGADGANELVEVALLEVGPTLKGANPATALLDVKAAPDEKAEAIAAASARQDNAPRPRYADPASVLTELDILRARA